MSVIGFKNLCPPALFYLVISVIAMMIMFMQNVGNLDLYCLGSYSCGVTNTPLIFIMKIIYVAFWTWVLNILCRSGYSSVSWFLVLFPFILMFLLITLLFFNFYSY